MKSLLPRIILFLLCLVPVAFSQDTPSPAGVHQHDGFFLRLVPGGGSSQFSMIIPDDKLSPEDQGKDFLSFTGGFTTASTIQIGGAVTENLIIYGETGGMFILSPTVKIFDEEMSNPGSVWVYSGGVGPGISYYFMPANVYVSGSVLANIAIAAFNGGSEGSKVGFGFHFVAGKEWWTGEQWGLGLAGYYRYGSQMNDGVDYITMSGSSFGILFSATFN
jgi:hypothetical protein